MEHDEVFSVGVGAIAYRRHENVRDRLIASALEVLRNEGSGFDLPLSLEQAAIDAVGISPAVAGLALRDETLTATELFRREVLARVFRREQHTDDYAFAERTLSTELQRQRGNIESDDLGYRNAAFRSVIRVGAEAGLSNLATNRTQAILVAAYDAVRAADEDEATLQWVRESLDEGERRSIADYSRMISLLAALFQQRIRSPFTVEQFAAAATAVRDGFSVRSGVVTNMDSVMRPTGPCGEDERWTQAGIALEGLVLMYFEPVNPDDPFVDLSRR